ncbi:MAG: G5 domain-containing protein [Coprobacillus sp.]
MLKKAKEIVVSADSRTKGILAVACVYFIVMFATVSSGAVNQIANFIPTVDIKLQDGVAEEKSYLVKQDTVTNVLGELNVELNKGDTLNKAMDYVVQQNDLIAITRVATKTVTQEEPIAYSTVTKGSGGWSTTVEQEGKDGIVKRTYLVTYANDKETSRKVIKEEIIKEPVDKVIRKGGVSEGTTFTGRLTTYGGDCNGCSGGSSAGVSLSPTTGVNGSGTPYLRYNGQKYYCLAADRSIPFGTVIKISNHNLSTADTIYGIVVDRGGAIKGNKIDIFKGSERGGNQYFGGGTSNNTKFEIVSMGSGRAYFWR